MEIHSNGGTKRFFEIPDFLENKKVVAFNRIKNGLYLRVTKGIKNTNKLLIGVPHLKVLPAYENQIQQIIKTYELKNIKYGEVLYFVIHSLANNIIASFYDITIDKQHILWNKFENYCVENNYPLINIDFCGKINNSLKGKIIREVESHEVYSLGKLDSKIIWRNL